MEKVNYCILAGISILFLVGCLIHLSENDIFSTDIIKKFRRLIYVLMFEVAIDCAFFLLEGSGAVSIVLYLLKSIELFINPVLAFLVFDIFYDRKKNRQDKIMRKIRAIILMTIVANGVLQIMVIFGEKVYSIDENNFYHRGPLMVLYVLFLLITILTLVFGIVVFSSKTQSIMKATLISFAAILIAGIVLRSFFPNNNYDFLSISVAIPFLLIYYSHVTLRVDPLTKLLNRQVYSRAVKSINYTTLIVIIDANCFKQINDAHGHECGDQTLKQLARLIYKTYGKYANCFRVGGDEFCVILKPNAFYELIKEIPHCDAYSMAETFIGRLDELIRIKIESDSNDCYLKYGVSQGYGIYYSQDDYPENGEKMPLEKVIELADKRMYHNKDSFMKNHPEASIVPERNFTRTRVLYEPSSPTLVEDDKGSDI